MGSPEGGSSLVDIIKARSLLDRNVVILLSIFPRCLSFAFVSYPHALITPMDTLETSRIIVGDKEFVRGRNPTTILSCEFIPPAVVEREAWDWVVVRRNKESR